MKKLLAIITAVLMCCSAIPQTLAAETAVGEYSWDFEEITAVPSEFTPTNKEDPYEIVSDPLGEKGNVFKLWNGRGGKGQEDGIAHKNNYGAYINVSENTINDTEVVVSADFMMPRYREIINLMAPYNSENQFGFAGSVQVNIDRSVVYNVDNNKTIKIGEVDINEWHTAAVKYTLSSIDGMTADVYFDGEKVLEGINTPTYTYGIEKFRISMDCNCTDAEAAANGRADGRNEITYYDNIYVGTKTDGLLKFMPKSAKYSDDGTVTISFSDAVDTSEFDETMIMAQSGDETIFADSAVWSNDNKALTITFASALTVGNTYAITIPSLTSVSGLEYDGGDVSVTAKTAVELNVTYNDFNSADGIKSISFKADRSGWTLPVTITDDGAARICCGVGSGSGDGSYANRDRQGLEIYKSEFGGYQGYAVISWKMMVEKNNITAVMTPRTTKAGNLSDVYFGIQGTNIIYGSGSNISVAQQIQPNEWHTFTAKYSLQNVTNAEFYVDGVKVGTAQAKPYQAMSSFFLSVNVNVDSETAAATTRFDSRGEYFRIDDMVVSKETGLYNAYTGGDFMTAYNAYLASMNSHSINTYLCDTNEGSKFRGIDGEVTAVVTGGFEGTVYAAVYDKDGKLKNIYAKGFDLDAGESEHISWVLTQVETTDKIKTFVWDAYYAPHINATVIQ